MSRLLLTHGVALLCPWLALVLGLQCAGAGKIRGSQLGWPVLVATGLLCWPIGGYSLAGWILGCSANFSIPLTGLLALAVAQRVMGRPLLDPATLWVGAVFGSGAGLLLYPMALGLGPVDPYTWGWRFSGLFGVMAILTGGLIWRGNHFGLLLLVAAASFQWRLLESANYWDYLIDPVYFLLSLAFWTTRLLKWVRRRPQSVQG